MTQCKWQQFDTSSNCSKKLEVTITQDAFQNMIAQIT